MLFNVHPLVYSDCITSIMCCLRRAGIAAAADAARAALTTNPPSPLCHGAAQAGVCKLYLVISFCCGIFILCKLHIQACILFSTAP